MNDAALKKAAKQAIRVFIIAVLTLFVPGILGWLNDLLDWANTQGLEPFPDVEVVGYLAISALVGGVIATLTFLLNILEGSLFNQPEEGE